MDSSPPPNPYTTLEDSTYKNGPLDYWLDVKPFPQTEAGAAALNEELRKADAAKATASRRVSPPIPISPPNTHSMRSTTSHQLGLEAFSSPGPSSHFQPIDSLQIPRRQSTEANSPGEDPYACFVDQENHPNVVGTKTMLTHDDAPMVPSYASFLPKGPYTDTSPLVTQHEATPNPPIERRLSFGASSPAVVSKDPSPLKKAQEILNDPHPWAPAYLHETKAEVPSTFHSHTTSMRTASTEAHFARYSNAPSSLANGVHFEEPALMNSVLGVGEPSTPAALQKTLSYMKSLPNKFTPGATPSRRTTEAQQPSSPSTFSKPSSPAQATPVRINAEPIKYKAEEAPPTKESAHISKPIVENSNLPSREFIIHESNGSLMTLLILWSFAFPFIILLVVLLLSKSGPTYERQIFFQ